MPGVRLFRLLILGPLHFQSPCMLLQRSIIFQVSGLDGMIETTNPQWIRETKPREWLIFWRNICSTPKKKAQLAVTVWRHKLMHTGEPRLLKENFTVYNWSISDQTNKHWTIENTGKDECLLSVGICNLISDLRQGVFGPQGYFCELRVDRNLQNHYANFLKEIQNYSFAIQI